MNVPVTHARGAHRRGRPGLPSAVIDHIAVAVPDTRLPVARCHRELGGGFVAGGRRAGSYIEQVRFRNDTKLEFLGPDPGHPDGARLEGFLRRHGSTIHHLTLLVPSVAEAVAALADAGVTCVGVSVDHPSYHDAFVPPAQAGGVLVQLTWKDVDDVGFARRQGQEPTAPAADGAEFLGARVATPDLRAAATQWELLGADVAGDDELEVRWQPGGLRLWVVPGAPGEVAELRFAGAAGYEASPALGPAVVA